MEQSQQILISYETFTSSSVMWSTIDLDIEITIRLMARNHTTYLSPSLISAPTSWVRNLGGLGVDSLVGEAGLGKVLGGVCDNELAGSTCIGSTWIAPGRGTLTGDWADGGWNCGWKRGSADTTCDTVLVICCCSYTFSCWNVGMTIGCWRGWVGSCDITGACVTGCWKGARCSAIVCWLVDTASAMSIGSADCLIEWDRDVRSWSARSRNICRSATLSDIGCTFCGPSGPIAEQDLYSED